VGKEQAPPHRNKRTGQWLQNREQVCPACFENFGTTLAGDAHRKLLSICLDPEIIGLIPIENQYGTRLWRLPND